MADLDQKVIVIEEGESQELLMNLLSRMEGYELVGVYADIGAVVERIGIDQPNIALLSLRSVGRLEEISLLKSHFPRIELIGLVNFSESDSIVKVLESGVSGLVLQPGKLTEIEKALQMAAIGDSFLSPALIRSFLETYQKNLSTTLSGREIEVLKLMSQGKTYSMIANELNISNNTSKSHIKNIYSKLSASTKAEAIEKALAQRII